MHLSGLKPSESYLYSHWSIYCWIVPLQSLIYILLNRTFTVTDLYTVKSYLYGHWSKYCWIVPLRSLIYILLNRTFTVTDLNTVDQLLSLVRGVINGSHNFTVTNHREIKGDKNEQLFASSLPPVSPCIYYQYAGERGGEWGKQAGIMNEESQVRGCYNITLITPTRKQCLRWKRHKQTKHLEHESKYKD